MAVPVTGNAAAWKAAVPVRAARVALTGTAAILAAHEKAWASGWKGAKPAAHDERLGRDHRDHRDNQEVPGMVLRAMKRLAGFALTNGAARQYSLRTGQ